MKQFTPVIYKGVVIFRNEPGYKLRYYARLPEDKVTGSLQVSADTLRGLKALITTTLLKFSK